MTVKLEQKVCVGHLKTDEDIARYLNVRFIEAEADGDFTVVAKALGAVVRTYGMTRLAKDTGLRRESLYKALSGAGNPSFATVLKVMAALGLQLRVGIANKCARVCW